MQKLYLEELEVKRLLNPRKSDKLIYLAHPERLLAPDTLFYKYSEDYVRMPFSTVTPIICNAIVTNQNHDGIWLTNGTDVTIPNAIMGEEMLEYIRRDQPVTAVYATIVDALSGHNNSFVNHPFIYDNIPDKIIKILELTGFGNIKVVVSILYGIISPNELNLFVLIEVDTPDTKIPPLMNYSTRDFIWYSRADHVMNSNSLKRDNPVQLFMNRRRGYDIRNDKHRGLELLDKVFNTEIIFGKLDIY